VPPVDDIAVDHSDDVVETAGEDEIGFVRPMGLRHAGLPDAEKQEAILETSGPVHGALVLIGAH
jgi:hypothetical protein